MAMKTTDHHIITLMRTDPERGCRLMMSAYMERIYWHVRRMVVSHCDAQDVTQEAFIRAYRSIDNFKGDSALSTWLYRIATNEALRCIERRNPDLVAMDDSFDALADEYVDYEQAVQVKLQRAVHSLPPRQQAVFNLRYFDRMEYDEIARVCDSSVAAVKSNYHIAKEKITKYLNA